MPRQPLPAPDAIAEILGGRRAGANDWRIAHICGGETGAPRPNAGLSLRWYGDRTTARCHYGCAPRDTYAALRRALGLDGGAFAYAPTPAPPDVQPAPPPGPAPMPRAERRRRIAAAARNYARAPAGYALIPHTSWPLPPYQPGLTYAAALDAIPGRWTAAAEYLLADGAPDETIRRFPPGPGAKTFWQPKHPDAPPRSHAGLHPRCWTPDAPPGAPAIIVEGEKAAAALVWAGAGAYAAVYSTWATAGMAGCALDAFARRRAVIWPDADGAGLQAAHTLAARMVDAGNPAPAIVPLRAVMRAARDAGAAAGPGDMDGLDAADLDGAAIHRLLRRALRDAPAPTGCPSLAAHRRIADALENAGFTLQGSYQCCSGNPAILVQPDRPPDLRCPYAGALVSNAESVYGARVATPLVCRECRECREWLRLLDAYRYAAALDARRAANGLDAGAPVQTAGCWTLDTPGAARALLTREGRNGAGARWTAIAMDAAGEWTARIVWLDGLDAGAAARMRRRAAREGIPLRLDDRAVSPGDIARWTPDARRWYPVSSIATRRSSPRPVNAVAWTGWPARYAAADADYAHTDGVTSVQPDSPEPDPVTCDRVNADRDVLDAETRAAAYAAIWLDGLDAPPPDAVARLVDAQRRGDVWPARAAVAEIRRATGYRGPRALLRDAVSDGTRPAHGLALVWLHGDALCNGCLRRARAPARALCLVCDSEGLDAPPPRPPPLTLDAGAAFAPACG